jgi:hypothetical protein
LAAQKNGSDFFAAHLFAGVPRWDQPSGQRLKSWNRYVT